MTRSFDVFFDLRLNKRLSKHSRRRWFETHYDVTVMKISIYRTGSDIIIFELLPHLPGANGLLTIPSKYMYHVWTSTAIWNDWNLGPNQLESYSITIMTTLGNGFLPFVKLNTLRPRQNGRHFPDDIFKCIFFNQNVWFSIKISLKFVPEVRINNYLALIQIMAWRRPGDKPLSEPMVVSLLTHICVTRPQWVNTMCTIQLG